MTVSASHMTRRVFVAAPLTIALSLSALSVSAMVGPAYAGQAEIYTGEIKGVAINGYDPVAYFTDEKPVAGSADITADWKGATWRFSSVENRDTFLADPEKYAPQYGGYCAYAVSSGYTASTDPSAFSIVDGKLYLNYSQGVRTQWSKDTSGYISKANANWPKVLE